MSAPAIEALLARLYTEEKLRKEFASDPVGVALREGLEEEEAQGFGRIDPAALELAADSYERKRGTRKRPWHYVFGSKTSR